MPSAVISFSERIRNYIGHCGINKRDGVPKISALAM